MYRILWIQSGFLFLTLTFNQWANALMEGYIWTVVTGEINYS